MKTIISNPQIISEQRKFIALVFTAGILLFFISAQNITAQSQADNSPQTSKEEFVMPSQTGSDQKKTERWSDENRYKVEKRNKKVSKMKVEQCETQENQKGTSKRETKEICEPKK